MKALIVDNNSKLKVQEIDKPKPNKGEVLIKTHSIGINRADILQKQGLYPPPKDASEILGIEVSGNIVGCGENADINLIGKNICALVTGGAYAEYVIVNIKCLIFLPENIPLSEGAAIPEAYLVSYLNLFYEAKLQVNELVYINAGASGVGIAAIQLALANGNKVITSAGSDEKVKFLKDLGVDLAINYKKKDVKSEIEKFYGKYKVNVILDMVAGEYFNDHLSLLAKNGRLILIGYQAGREVTIDLAKLLIKNLFLKGRTLRADTVNFKQELIQLFQEQYWDKFKSREITPIISKYFNFEDAESAHEFMLSNQNIGKLILTI